MGQVQSQQSNQRAKLMVSLCRRRSRSGQAAALATSSSSHNLRGGEPHSAVSATPHHPQDAVVRPDVLP